MSGRCRCGNEVRYAFHELSCFDCGDGLCPACAVPLESVSYCRSCAGRLLETRAVESEGRFDL